VLKRLGIEGLMTGVQGLRIRAGMRKILRKRVQQKDVGKFKSSALWKPEDGAPGDTQSRPSGSCLRHLPW
jgi:hypothetical protein